MALAGVLTAGESEKLPRANSARLTFDDEGRAYLNIKTKKKTPDGYQDNVHRVLFSGIAFTEGENWRAEVTYKDGILDGPVSVVVNQRILYQFRYEQGRRVLGEDPQGGQGK